MPDSVVFFTVAWIVILLAWFILSGFIVRRRARNGWETPPVVSGYEAVETLRRAEKRGRE